MKYISIKDVTIYSPYSPASYLAPELKLNNNTIGQILNYTINNTNMTGVLPNNNNYIYLNTYNITNNNFSSPPGWTMYAGNIQSLSIANNPGITTLPSLGYASAALKEVYAYTTSPGGPIKTIPSLFKDLNNYSNLQYFWIQNNQITGTVPKVQGHTGLVQFLGRNNQFTGLPPGMFSGCTGIQAITLDNCKFARYVNNPEFWFSGCNNLKLVDFNTNKFSGYLPRMDYSVGLGHTIDFSNNSFNFVQTDYFTGYNFANGIQTPTMRLGVSNLKVFNISNNKIYNGAIPFPIFRSLATSDYLWGAPLLEEIYLGTNRITGNWSNVNSYGGFSNLPAYGMQYLKTYDISNNNLTQTDIDNIIYYLALQGRTGLNLDFRGQTNGVGGHNTYNPNYNATVANYIKMQKFNVYSD
jgi:hypothetical protein